MADQIRTRVLTYPDLQSPDFISVNPLKKVPAFIREDGTCVFESMVILDYLEDKYKDEGLHLSILIPNLPYHTHARKHTHT